MIRQQLDFELRYNLFLAKGRNIWYYRNQDTRPRAQYIHILRDFRQLAFELSHEVPKNDTEKIKLLDNVLMYIPKKVKSEECFGVILGLIDILSGNGK